MWYTPSDTPHNEAFYSKSTTRNGWTRLCRRLRASLRSGGALLAKKPSTTMKKTIAALSAALFLFPAVSSAAGLTYQQASSIIVLLQAFGVDNNTVQTVWNIVKPADTTVSPPTIATTQQTQQSFGGTIVVNPQPTQSMDESTITSEQDVSLAPTVVCDDTPVFKLTGMGLDANTSPILSSQGGSIMVNVTSECVDAQWLITLDSPRNRNAQGGPTTINLNNAPQIVGESNSYLPNYGQGTFDVYSTDPTANNVNGVNYNNGQYIITATDAVHGGKGQMILNVGVSN